MVEIKINTNSDSREDIKNAVNFLNNYLEGKTNNFEEVAPKSFNMFGDDSIQREQPKISEPKKEDDSDIQIKPIFY